MYSLRDFSGEVGVSTARLAGAPRDRAGRKDPGSGGPLATDVGALPNDWDTDTALLARILTPAARTEPRATPSNTWRTAVRCELPTGQTR
jgi:hypothetical protein